MKCHFHDCKKKVNTFSSVECICGHFFCKNHNLTFQHNCIKTETIKLDQKTFIQKNNPIIKTDVWNLNF